MISRRTLLKSGAATALLALTGCGNEETSSFVLPSPAPPGSPIASVAIHPAIGIARVGNGEGYFLGPETPATPTLSATGFKDATGALRRQAARFRVYGLDAQGRAVRELTDAEVTWSVHLANRKAAWYQFATPMDIPEAEPTTLRNAGQSRAALTIDAGPQSVSGRGAPPVVCATPSTYLGEILTDESGRLLVLGGRGVSRSLNGTPPTTFANNEGWIDDVSDGPVTARVVVNGQSFAADPAWVIVAPPNYAPAIVTDYRTLYDVMYQTMLDGARLVAPAQVSFAADIFPLFDRLTQLQWVNDGLARQYGWGSPEYFLDPVLLGRLISDAGLRRELFSRFRPPGTNEFLPQALPPYLGDAVAVPANSPRNWITVTDYQYQCLGRWAAGDFVNDAAAPLAELLDTVPVALQPAALDRAVLEACLGGAFHPGCEATWPMRHASMYSGLFRLRHRDGGEPQFGPTLTPDQAISLLIGSGPGEITRWMAVPWQTDTASCRSGYYPDDPYLPTFWPARVPNHVLRAEDYARVMDPALPLAERLKAFANRPNWLRNVPNLEFMVENWFRLGVVEERPGPGDAAFPRVLKVETGNSLGA